MIKINLSKEEIYTEELSIEILNEYLGGRGLGVKLLYDNLGKGVDPLSPQNILVFSVGPLTSIPLPTSGRLSLVTKSPLTNTILHSNSGGFWGPFFRRNGYYALYITGKFTGSSKGYILIDGTNIEIKDASELWGLTTEETLKKLTALEGNCQVLMIGPAGENQVKFASIMNQAHRAFGRGGAGAVMGSKGLKAIAVKNGQNKVQPQNPVYLKKLNQVAADKIRVFPITSQGLPLFGTAVMMKVINAFGMLPIKNNQKGADERIDLISGERLREKFFEKNESCFSCPIRCGRWTNTGDQRGKGPEFESLWALGPQCGIFDLKIITHANYLCNKLGLDTISTGNTIACAMELHQRGLLDRSISFGDSQKLMELVNEIAYKRNLGKELAEGALRFAKKYNGTQYAMQVKGLELPAYDPRGAMGQALNYATSNRGGCHLTGYLIAMELLGVPKLIDRLSIAAKADQLVLKQNQSAVEDSLIICKFVGFALGFDFQIRFLRAVTGRDDLTIAELVKIGERIYNLERLFNVQEGFTRIDDNLPERFLKEHLPGGRIVPLDKLLDEYYHVRGWDDNGIPTNEVLEKLNLKR